MSLESWNTKISIEPGGTLRKRFPCCYVLRPYADVIYVVIVVKYLINYANHCQLSLGSGFQLFVRNFLVATLPWHAERGNNDNPLRPDINDAGGSRQVAITDVKSCVNIGAVFFFFVHRLCEFCVRIRTKMADGGAAWKSDYPNRHFYFFGGVGLLLAICIVVLEVK